MKYYSDNYATIEWDAAAQCIKTTLAGIPRHSHHFRLIQRKRLEFISLLRDRFQDLYILTDSRKAGPLIPEDISFFRNKVVPRLAQLGVRKMAVIEPEGFFSRLVVREMMEGAEKVKLALFHSEEEAKNWLLHRAEPVM
ncbi:MAG: hypothetical protein ACOYXA_12345 [Bacteroidota bacterium]